MRITDSFALVGSLQFGLSGPFDCHVYALAAKSGIVLIDSGAGTHTGQLLQNLEADLPGLSIAALLITHVHMDHCGGAASIRERTGCTVITPRMCRDTIERGDEEASGLKGARQQGLYPPDMKFQSCAVDLTVEDGERFTAAGFEFTAIHIRGHSQDAHCYLTRVRDQNHLFTGDVVFYGGVLGVINSPGSGMEGYRSDITKLGNLGVEGLFPGHGMFTVSGGQRHLDVAIQQVSRGFLPRQVGQGDAIF